MKIIFLSNWGVNDFLTVSTVYPHLQILNEIPSIEKILFFCIERYEKNVNFIQTDKSSKIVFQPLYSLNIKIKLINKIVDYLIFPFKIYRIIRMQKIDYMFARSSEAGAILLILSIFRKIPFVVESYEPHADYMIDSGVWHKLDPRTLFLKSCEYFQNKKAYALLPVSEAYKAKLVSKGIKEEKIITVPCGVPLEKFKYNPTRRKEIRKKLRILDEFTVGIYIGKLGGLYYNSEVPIIVNNCFKYFENFFFIMLSPQDNKQISNIMRIAGIDPNRMFISSANHSDIPDYLSASDIAFTFNKPGESKKYLSLVKIGEYWANGLPILLTEGIGDESDFIENVNGGALYTLDQGNLINAMNKIKKIIQNEDHRIEIKALAEKYRSFIHVKNAYNSILINNLKKQG